MQTQQATLALLRCRLAPYHRWRLRETVGSFLPPRFLAQSGFPHIWFQRDAHQPLRVVTVAAANTFAITTFVASILRLEAHGTTPNTLKDEVGSERPRAFRGCTRVRARQRMTAGRDRPESAEYWRPGVRRLPH